MQMKHNKIAQPPHVAGTNQANRPPLTAESNTDAAIAISPEMRRDATGTNAREATAIATEEGALAANAASLTAAQGLAPDAQGLAPNAENVNPNAGAMAATTGASAPVVGNQNSAAPEILPSFANDILRTFKLFWPLFLGQLASTGMSVADTVMAGAAGTIELSGVAIGVSLYVPAVLFVLGLSMGVQPIVAHLRGAGRENEIAVKMHSATIICLIVSVLVGIIMCFLPLLYHLMPNIDKEMVRVGQGYLIAVAAGMPAIAMYNILHGYWEGLGITMPTLLFGLFSLILNVPLNWIFIFGHFGAPALGGIGCGVATSITIYLTIIFMFIYVKTSKHFVHCRLYVRWYSVPFSEVKQFLAFAFPLALSTTIEATCFSIVALLLSPFGPATVAGHTIALNVMGVIFMIPLSIASATTIRVGAAMGAMNWERSRRIVQGAYTLGFSFYVIYFTTILLGHDFIVGLYSDDLEVMPIASYLLMLCIIFLLPDSMQVISIGILRGFKDSRTILIITILCYWLIGLPVGYVLAYGIVIQEPMSASGFWIGFICALSCACLIYLSRIFYIFKTHHLPKTFAISSSII